MHIEYKLENMSEAKHHTEEKYMQPENSPNVRELKVQKKDKHMLDADEKYLKNH